MSARTTAVRHGTSPEGRLPGPQEVQAVIDTVPDPEMPPVSVAELGMVVDVRVHERAEGAHVEVDLVATFSGCPATEVIRAEVAAAVGRIEGVAGVDVRFVRHVTWTPERISESAHDKLRAFGIAPPGGSAPAWGPAPVGGAAQAGVTPLPLVGVGRVTCPLCGSQDTVTDSPFGPTPCRSTHYCQDCRNPFEAIKD